MWVLIPEKLYSKRDFVDVIKLKTLRQEDYPGLSSQSLDAITSVIKGM